MSRTVSILVAKTLLCVLILLSKLRLSRLVTSIKLGTQVLHFTNDLVSCAMATDSLWILFDTHLVHGACMEMKSASMAYHLQSVMDVTVPYHRTIDRVVSVGHGGERASKVYQVHPFV